MLVGDHQNRRVAFKQRRLDDRLDLGAAFGSVGLGKNHQIREPRPVRHMPAQIGDLGDAAVAGPANARALQHVLGAGFDRLVQLDPQEIQIGILKRLRGTPITRHDADWEMCYSASPPYEILSNKLISFETMQRLRRFARYWDLIANNGNFPASRKLIWQRTDTPFASFLDFSDWFYLREQKTHGIPLPRLAERLFEFLTRHAGLDEQQVAQCIWADYTRGGREDRPAFLRRFDLPHPGKRSDTVPPLLPARQSRHRERQPAPEQ